jgi:hypothetical protein
VRWSLLWQAEEKTDDGGRALPRFVRRGSDRGSVSAGVRMFGSHTSGLRCPAATALPDGTSANVMSRSPAPRRRSSPGRPEHQRFSAPCELMHSLRERSRGGGRRRRLLHSSEAARRLKTDACSPIQKHRPAHWSTRDARCVMAGGAGLPMRFRRINVLMAGRQEICCRSGCDFTAPEEPASGTDALGRS